MTHTANRTFLDKIIQAFEEIFEYNDYTWDQIEFRNAYAQQKKIKEYLCDSDLYSCDKQFLQDIHRYFYHYSINDNIRNLIPVLYAIIRFDYNESFYIELNQLVLKPDRVQNMATTYSIDFFDYLDKIM